MHEISGGVSTTLRSPKRKLMASKPICHQVIPVCTENNIFNNNGQLFSYAIADDISKIAIN